MEAASVSKKTPVKRTQLSSVEDPVGLNESPPVSSKKSVSTKKRKLVYVEVSEDESSGIEVLDATPTPVMPKGKGKYTKREAIALGEPVVITSKQAGTNVHLLPARRLSFGSIGTENQVIGTGVEVATDVPTSSTALGKRIRKPTEKAVASQDLSATFDALDDNESSSDPPLSIIPIKKAKNNKGKGRKSVSKKPVIPSDRDSDDIPKAEPVIKNEKSSASKKGKKKAISTEKEPSLSAGEQIDYIDQKPSTPSEWQVSDSNAGPVPNSQVVGSTPNPDDHPDSDPIVVADESAKASTPKANLHEAVLPESVPP